MTHLPFGETHITVDSPASEVLIPEHSCCVCSAPARSPAALKGITAPLLGQPRGGVYWQYRLKSFMGASYLIPPALLRQKSVTKRIPNSATCTHWNSKALTMIFGDVISFLNMFVPGNNTVVWLMANAKWSTDIVNIIHFRSFWVLSTFCNWLRLSNSKAM